MIFGGVFSELHDRRRARGKRYGFEPLLCAVVLSMLAGATSLRKIEAFIDERLEQLNQLFGTSWRKAPSWVGIRRFLLEIDEAELESAIRTHAHGLTSPPSGRQFIAIDGKALRGSASRVLDTPARQLVSAFDHDDLIVLGHVEVSDKSNEIPAAQALIESMGLPRMIFTLDALHCQKKR
jgi:DDE_Tnp_1-associated